MVFSHYLMLLKILGERIFFFSEDRFIVLPISVAKLSRHEAKRAFQVLQKAFSRLWKPFVGSRSL